MRLRWTLWACALFVSLAALLAGGCSDSIYAKGTPFYDGPVKSDSERVQMWPLAYYQDPNLSVLWPLFEKTPDHLAVRPLWSVYGLDGREREYNVLWPLNQFDFQSGDHRIFPFFWGGNPGDRYFVLFPEVWWSPYNKAILPFFWGTMMGDRYFVLFPWIWSYEDGGCAFPFFWGGAAGDRHFVAFPEVWWYPDNKVVFPFFWGGRGDDSHFVVFPEFWWLRDSRCIFPAYWTRNGNTAAVFPLFWYERGEYCHLLPLWMRFSDSVGSDNHLLWPLVNFKDDSESAGWRFWPLAGDYRARGRASRYSFALWPLGHFRRDGDERMRLFLPLYYDFAGKDWARRALVPLYYGARDGDGAVHLTPLYSTGRSKEGSWSLCLPLFYHGADAAGRSSQLLTPLFASFRDGEHSKTVIPPALSWMTRDGTDRDLWALGPLFHSRWGGAVHQGHAMPLYYYDREGGLFFSPLYAQGGGAAPWNLLVPFYYRRSDPKAGTSLLVTPLFGRTTEGERSRWLTLPGFCSFGRNGAERSLWALGPLAHFRWGGGRVENHFLPLYYYDGGDGTFLSPLYSQGGTPERRWSFLLPAYWHGSEPARQADQLVTPLFGRFQSGGSDRWVVWPALSSFKSDGPDRDLWALGPLAHFRWGGAHRQSHVFPLYFSDRESDSFVSLPFSRRGGDHGYWNLLGLGAHSWREGAEHPRLLVPPALTFYSRDGEDRDLWTLGPLARFRWGGEHHQSHVLPLYVYDRERELFLTLPFSSRGGDDGFWNVLGFGAHLSRSSGGARSLLLPAALSAFSWDRQGERDLWTLGPLVHARWGGGRHQNHFLPLWYYDREEHTLLTLPFSRQGGADGFWNVLGLLAHSAKDDGGHRTLRVLAPFTAFAHDKDYGRASVYPLFSTSRQGDFRSTWVFPWFITEGSAASSHCSFVPLWWYDSNRTEAAGYRRNFHVLGWLYEDHQEHIGPAAPKEGPAPAEHVRRQVLWKLYDYERSGQNVAMDCFPFISYDKRPAEGLKRVSFAWRLFRWERSAGGGRKLDVLFIPLVRRAGEGRAEPEPKVEPGPTPVSVPAPAPTPAEVGAGGRQR